MKRELEKTYSPNEVEEKIYEKWEKGEYFKSEINPEGEPFCVIMPPPNANGSLHLGHAVFVTLEDIMARFARMNGYKTLWLPGADHAGFETQVVFEKKLGKEGKSRFQIGRDELYKMMWDFTQQNKSVMEGQLRKLGASCDWNRAKFTLDEDIKRLVYKTFKKLYEDGLVYRAGRLVNWCPKHQTSLSDLEVKFDERNDFIYEIAYGSITVATTRPETMFGDTAVAVHPEDDRYKDMIGKLVPLPLTDREIPVIADEAVDREFGTGAVKITPAHDSLDFEIGKRHELELIQVIDERAKMRLGEETKIDKEVKEKIEGLKVKEAREITVELLKEAGVLGEVKAYGHSVGTCYKCGNVIEPLPKEQWFVAMNKKGEKSGKILAKDALEAIRGEKIKFVPDRFEKIITYWLENIRDWNISRQIVWGIQIPVWYCQDCGELMVEEEEPKKCAKCQSGNLKRDPDVFDTWFSSGQWPVITLQSLDIKNGTKDFETFYPTSVMETAADILFFWVARMIMFGLYLTDEVPFRDVYLHGLVRDKDRQKMSKSKGNVIDPLGVATDYGTDAVRMALVFGTGAGNDTVVSEDKIRGMRNFANKLWNISRFIFMNLEDREYTTDMNKPETKSEADKIILKELDQLINEADGHYKNYRFSQAGEVLYEFIWHKFADVYLEKSKEQMLDEEFRKNTQDVLIYVLSRCLILLHPIMPYVTEEIYGNIFPDEGMLITARWPK